jgi:hypothetical protein
MSAAFPGEAGRSAEFFRDAHFAVGPFGVSAMDAASRTT